MWVCRTIASSPGRFIESEAVRPAGLPLAARGGRQPAHRDPRRHERCPSTSHSARWRDIVQVGCPKNALIEHAQTGLRGRCGLGRGSGLSPTNDQPPVSQAAKVDTPERVRVALARRVRLVEDAFDADTGAASRCREVPATEMCERRPGRRRPIPCLPRISPRWREVGDDLAFVFRVDGPEPPTVVCSGVVWERAWAAWPFKPASITAEAAAVPTTRRRIMRGDVDKHRASVIDQGTCVITRNGTLVPCFPLIENQRPEPLDVRHVGVKDDRQLAAAVHRRQAIEWLLANGVESVRTGRTRSKVRPCLRV